MRTHGTRTTWRWLRRLPPAARLAAGLLLGAALLAGAGNSGDAGGSGETDPPGRAETVLVPAGEVRLGSTPEEIEYGYEIGGRAARKYGWFDDEPLRTVTLPAYRMDRTPVTQAAYGAFVRATGHRVPYISAAAYREQGFLVHPYEEVLPYLWHTDRPPQGRADHPVVLVSHGDAGAYCAWRGERGGRTCRLPTEDEFEKAARGTDARIFPWGDAWAPDRLNTQAAGPYGTTPVNAHPRGRSPYGLYDMAGNVFQWTDTPGKAGEYIVKGCSWDDLPGICRAAARHDRPADSRHILIGFRCACEAGSGAAARED